MNVYDSQRMADVAARDGYQEAAKIEDADLIVLNTCHIRERASEKIYSELGKVRELTGRARERRAEDDNCRGRLRRAGGRAPKYCAGSRRSILSSARRTIIVCRNCCAAASRRPGIVDTAFPVEDKFDHLPVPRPATIRSRGVSAFVTVQEGCDKFCSFCVVPYTRGAESSRPVAKVMDEIAHLAAAGVREVTLIGQNVNAYHGQGDDGRIFDLADLLSLSPEFPASFAFAIRPRIPTI